MPITALMNRLWGPKAKVQTLLFASLIMLFLFLGSRDLWTQEHRWADIVAGMFFRHDFLHPYLGNSFYYDKPLLSYWLIALLAKLNGSLTTWTLRLPTALFGVIAILSTYSIGKNLKDKQLGLLSGWMLLTTFYFVFWSRVSITDILNLGGSTLAIAWYISRRQSQRLLDYAIFFMILGATSLFKGLVGAIIPIIAVLTDAILQNSWRRHLNAKIFVGLLPGLLIYFFPFWASTHFIVPGYGENGLSLVYQENFLRYFKPFDHKDPFYTYFIFLPVYMFPWSLLLIPAIFSIKKRWQHLSLNSKWIALSFLFTFMFFTFSGSRRSYYIFPVIPFAILFTADWILSGSFKRQFYSAIMVSLSFISLLISIDLYPAWYYHQYGVQNFANEVKSNIASSQSFSDVNVILLDAESKIFFYLALPPNIKYYHVLGERDQQTEDSLLEAWPVILKKPSNTIFITRKCYANLLDKYFAGYKMVEMRSPKGFPFAQKEDVNSLVAFIPNNSIL